MPDPGTYATLDEFKAYAPSLAYDDLTLTRALQDASRDIDRFITLLPRSTTATPPLKFDVAKLDADSVEGLNRATLAQAEYRIVQGPDFFVQTSGTEIKGPDFTITNGGAGRGAASYLAPTALQELIAYRLVLTQARARP